MFYFYSDYWAPNGTSDLIITDEDGQIKMVLNEALFGAPVSDDGMLAMTDGDSIFGTGRDIGDHEGLPEDAMVWQLEAESVLRYIAVSPLSDGQETIDIIKGYL